VNNHMKLRLGVFLGTLLACALAERLLPRRERVAGAGRRWSANLGLSAVGALAAALLLPFTIVEAAYHAEARGIGLLNQRPLYYPLKFALSFILLDLAVYVQHRLFHWSPALWRLHAVHHTDLDLDASTGVRFHPAELLLSAVIKGACVVLLGAHFLAVLAFELALNAAATFNHANLNLGALDAPARLALVTPDMHRIHHSPGREETDSNFGFILPWWDRLFRTYRAEPREPHESMALGLNGARDPDKLDFFSLLGRPFRRAA